MARDWLSPEEYQRLSPAERKQLWAERKLARHNRQYRRTSSYRGMPRWQRKMLTVLALFVAIGIASLFSDRTVGGDALPVTAATFSAGETVEAASAGEWVEFGTCVWGGGENCVVDGDTFYLHGEKIRIAGIDAPETHDFHCPGEKALGDRATERLRELLNSGPVTLSSIDRDRDVYGRLLRNVAVSGADVGDALISEQLARAYRGYKMGWC